MTPPKTSPEDSEEDRHDRFPLVCKLTQCIFCLGNERKSYQGRTAEYARPNKMMNEVETLEKICLGRPSSMSSSPVHGQWIGVSTCGGVQKSHCNGAQDFVACVDTSYNSWGLFIASPLADFLYDMLRAIINLYIFYLTKKRLLGWHIFDILEAQSWDDYMWESLACS